MTKKILLVDDDSYSLVIGEKFFRKTLPDVEILVAHHATPATQLIQKENPLVVILDLCLESQLGVESGFSLLRKCLEIDSTIRIIVMTGYDDQQYGIKAMRLGAASFLSKPVSYPHLSALVLDGIQQSLIKRSYRDSLQISGGKLAQRILGPSKFNLKLAEALFFAANNDQSVLITGETGTGKGFCAELIHEFSSRTANKFVRLQPLFSNSDIVTSELFGHQKGSFTGAVNSRLGLLHEANQGTLFLDEIDCFSPEIQVSLLGVLQNKKFRAIGSNQESFTDFRLISATNQPMDLLLQNRKFRPDLYYRIAGFQIMLIPLRDRKEDLEVLANSFLNEKFSLSALALKKLYSYDWPGNIRELMNVIVNAQITAQIENRLDIQVKDLNFYVNQDSVSGDTFHEKIEQYKFNLVKEALLKNSYSYSKTARFLGIDRGTVKKIIDTKNPLSEA